MEWQQYTLTLVSVGERRVEVMKALRATFPKMSVFDARGVVDSAPVLLGVFNDDWWIEALDQALTQAGAVLEIDPPLPVPPAPTSIPERCVQRLKDACLVVWGYEHGDGIINSIHIGKTVDTPGNSLAGYSMEYALGGWEPVEGHDDMRRCPDGIVTFDAPPLYLHGWNDKFFIGLAFMVGGCSWKTFGTPDEAVDFILELFFGDPSEMQSLA